MIISLRVPPSNVRPASYGSLQPASVTAHRARPPPVSADGSEAFRPLLIDLRPSGLGAERIEWMRPICARNTPLRIRIVATLAYRTKRA